MRAGAFFLHKSVESITWLLQHIKLPAYSENPHRAYISLDKNKQIKIQNKLFNVTRFTAMRCWVLKSVKRFIPPIHIERGEREMEEDKE